MAEHSTVNRRVAGSSPAWGAIKEMSMTSPLFYLIFTPQRPLFNF